MPVAFGHQRGPKAPRVRLVPWVRHILRKRASSARTPFRDVLRARIILLAAQGQPNATIARTVGCSERTVGNWRIRFSLSSGPSALEDEPRSGRPAQIPLSIRCELLKLACRRPDGSHAPFRDVWTLDSLAEALKKDTNREISRSEIWRTLHAQEIRPHYVRYWLHSPDPDFRTKVEAICRLYLNPPAGATVLCVDEKTGIQALERTHPMSPPRRGRAGRYEFEYVRHGTRALIASFEPRTGRVVARCGARRTAADLLRFMELVARSYPTGPVYIIWDNLNIHCGSRWEEFNRRHGGRFHFVYTPLHASWVNQIESWFSILQRRVIKHGDFRTADELGARILGFIEHWNRAEAHGFRWRLRRIRSPQAQALRAAA